VLLSPSKCNTVGERFTDKPRQVLCALSADSASRRKSLADAQGGAACLEHTLRGSRYVRCSSRRPAVVTQPWLPPHVTWNAFVGFCATLL
jgi:hypothetical protein